MRHYFISARVIVDCPVSKSGSYFARRRADVAFYLRLGVPSKSVLTQRCQVLPPANQQPGKDDTLRLRAALRELYLAAIMTARAHEENREAASASAK